MVARRRLADAAARWVVTAGGLATIVSIVGILVFICFEVYPLLRPPRVERTAAFPLAAEGREFAPATDEGQSVLGVLTARGAVRFVRLADGSAVQELPLPEVGTAHITAARRVGPTGLVAGTSDGRLLAARVSFDVRRGDGARAVEPRVVGAGVWPLALDQTPITLLASSQPDETGVVAVFVAGDGAVQLYAVSQRQDLFGNAQRSEARAALPLPTGARPTSLAVSTNGRRAFVGTADGHVRYWDLTDREQPQLVDTVDATGDSTVGVTATALLIGDQSLVVGDAAGRVSTWFPVRDATREHGWRLQRVHVLSSHGAAVTAIAASPRDKRFLTADAGGEVRLQHATTGANAAHVHGRHRVGGGDRIRPQGATGPSWSPPTVPYRAGSFSIRIPRSVCGRCSARCGTKATNAPPTSGSPPAAPTTSSPS